MGLDFRSVSDADAQPRVDNERSDRFVREAGVFIGWNQGVDVEEGGGMETTDRIAYVARCKCGGLVMACVDQPEHRKETAKAVADSIRKGYSIERITCEAIRTTERFCMGECTEKNGG